MMFPPINEGTVACPACQAAIGAWCLNTRGTRLGGDRKPRPHPERTKAFKVAERQRLKELKRL